MRLNFKEFPVSDRDHSDTPVYHVAAALHSQVFNSIGAIKFMTGLHAQV